MKEEGAEPPNELLERFKELGWSYNKLAIKVAEIKGKESNSIKTGVIHSLKNPQKASLENLQAIAQAMGGKLVFAWLHIDSVKNT